MNIEELLKHLNLSTFVSLDFETTGLDPTKDKIIEVAAIQFVNGKPAKKFSTLVNPLIPIPSFITNITGIDNKMVSAAPIEKDIIDDLLGIIGDFPVVAHNIKFDWGYLLSLIKKYDTKILNNKKYDTLQLARGLLFDHPVFNLAALSEYFGLDASGSHRAVKDTENCGFIFIELIKELSSYSLEQISKIIALVENYDIPNKMLYIDYGNILLKKGDLKGPLNSGIINERNSRSSVFEYNGYNADYKKHASEVFGSGGLLDKKYDWYEDRVNQVEYAAICDNILDREGTAILEAGTGLGKSMAYLFSAIKRKEQTDSRGPVIIGCNTKHLQDQLFYKDLPTLCDALDNPITAILLKGRKNYICKTRLNWLINDKSILDDNNIETIIPILFWLERTKSGDITECSGFLNSRKNWIQSLICSDRGFCTSDFCANNNGCYYGPIRKLIFEADIIIANHSLILAEAKSPGIFPEHDTIIIDEVHNLAKMTYDQFKIELNQHGFLLFINSIDPSNPRSKRWNNIILSLSEIDPKIKIVREKIFKGIEKIKNSFDIFIHRLSIENEHFFDKNKTYQDRPIIYSIEKQYSSVYFELVELKNNINSLQNDFIKLMKLIRRIDKSKNDFRYLHNILDSGYEGIKSLSQSLSILTENQNNNWVYWMDGKFLARDDKLNISLHASVIDISETLRENLFTRFKSILLTSATIKVDDSFDYFLNRNGLDYTDSIITSDFKSPFSYEDQVTFYQYGGSQDISGDTAKLSDMIYYFHKTFQKRMMVLFTSTKILSEVAEKIKIKSNGGNIPVFAQSRGASKPAMINGMRMHKNGLLLGTNSFWEGVDFPGDLLELLVVIKLPFDVPSDPLIKSYGHYLDGLGVNSFMNYAVPECAIRFRQGFGRLIRTSFDLGVFISLDNRIVRKSYGEVFLNSIPKDPIIFDDHNTIEK